MNKPLIDKHIRYIKCIYSKCSICDNIKCKKQGLYDLDGYRYDTIKKINDKYIIPDSYDIELRIEDVEFYKNREYSLTFI